MDDQAPASPEREALTKAIHVILKSGRFIGGEIAAEELAQVLIAVLPAAQPSAAIPPPLPSRSCRHGLLPDQCEFCDSPGADKEEATRRALLARPSAAQPSADVVGLRDALLDVHILRYDRDDPYGYWTCGCGQMLAPDGVDEYRTHLLEALAAAREAGPPGAGEGRALELLRAVRDADVIFAKGDWPLSQKIAAYLDELAAPTRRTSDAG